MKKTILIFLFIFSISVAGADHQSDQTFLEKTENISDSIKQDYNINGEIEIKLDKIKIGSAETRKYLFNNYQIILDKEKLENATDIELTGLLSHEMAHLESYSSMNFFQLTFFTLHYLISDSFNEKIEKQADYTAIQKGFGEELLAFRIYRLETATEKEIYELKKYYLFPEEISELIKN